MIMNLEPSTSSSTATSGISTRQNDKTFLIGYMSYQITGSKLPSNGQVLHTLFYNKRQVKLKTREAANLTIQEVQLFWQKAKIPIKYLKDCIAKLEKLHEEWLKLQKNATRSGSLAQSKKEEDFKLRLDDLFDIAHQDALKNINEEDRQFLLLQRQKGRIGCIGSGDKKFLLAEKRRAKRKVAEMARLEKLKRGQVGFLEVEDTEMEFSSTSSASEEEESHGKKDIGVKDYENCQDTAIDTLQTKKRKYCRGSQELSQRSCQCC